MSLPVRGAWIEIRHPAGLHMSRLSLPVRGAWIEIVAVTSSTIAIPRRSP